MGLSDRFDELHRAATEATGLHDFGPLDYVEPLKLALSEIERRLPMSPAIEGIWFASLQKQLVGRLLAHDGFKKYPHFAAGKVKRPLIITGMLRTGTSALHRLLAADPASQSLELWLADSPMPRPPREEWESNPWFQASVEGLEFVRTNIPQFLTWHPQYADKADECHVAVMKSLWSIFIACSALPEYREWYAATDPRYAYEFYYKVLALIAGGDQRRWVLKDPNHLWGMEGLLDVFPDACVVFTHRDLRTAMTSTASLVYQFRSLIEPNVTQVEQGRDIVDLWGFALDRAERIRQRHDPARFLDVHIDQTRDDPVGLAESIYRHFDIPFTDAAKGAFARHSADDPRVGHGAHAYAAEEFGITEEMVRKGTGAYYERSRRICERFAPAKATT